LSPPWRDFGDVIPLSVSDFEVKAIYTSGVYSVWARDLYFGAWNFHDFHQPITLFIPKQLPVKMTWSCPLHPVHAE
jgi:hypothetical protein